MGYTTDLLEGLGKDLDALGIGTWRDNGIHTSGETGIVVGAIPAAPDRLITLTSYGVDDNPTLTDDVIGVQARFRWGGQDPRPADDLADSVFDLWHGAGPFTLPTGVRVLLLARQSWTSLGQDDNDRWSRSDNYYATVHRPSPHRT